MPVTVKRESVPIKTYVPKSPNSLPYFIEGKAYQGACGRAYPLPVCDQLSNQAVSRAYDLITLENEHIKINLLPEIGGKVYGGIDKHNGYEFIYQNPVIKPALVGLAGPWVSGGIEFNWAQHHRPTTFMPLEATLRTNQDGSVTCWMGEAEPFHRLRGAVGITVYPGKSYVEARAILYNRTDTPLPFMWWNNLAVRVNPSYRALFPPDVQFVSDHDRRAVISYPLMQGIFHTARPYDYGAGVDASWYTNIKLPTSIMVQKGCSHMAFLGGYDYAAQAGTISVADPYISVGKKMWTWGNGDFGKAWCANLTDNGDRYIELMTGVYTDNQPDFTYLMPGESKEFTQYWYPIRDIGQVVNATREAALALSHKGAILQIGAITTSDCPRAKLTLRHGDELLFQQTVRLSPAQSFVQDLPWAAGKDLQTCVLTLTDENGRELVRYAPQELRPPRPPRVRPIPPRPGEVSSVEELYLQGAHLEQYKHHTYKAEDYYCEALRHEPDDYRCNLALGRLSAEKGQFAQARKYLQKAIDRLTLRNDNPADTEAFYQLARVERLTGHLEQAYELYQNAAWQYAWRSQSYYEIACLDCQRGRRQQALHYLELALETNTHFFAARVLKAYLQQDDTQLQAVLEITPQDTFARAARWLLGGPELPAFILNRPEDMLDAALDFKKAGLLPEAARILQACQKPDLLTQYHLAALTGEAVRPGTLDYCFPNRLEDLPVLEPFATWEANYLRGCLYYDRLNYAAAAAAWEQSRRQNPRHAYTLRNLAWAYFDHLDRKDDADLLLRQALELAPDNARLLYEYLQLRKNRQASVEERLALLESYPDLLAQRDDLYLDWIILNTQAGRYLQAAELLKVKRFNIYEGGEGKLTRQHGWLFLLMAKRAMDEKDFELARADLLRARVYPQNYGEGRHYSAQESHIWYAQGRLLEAMGQTDAARQAYQAAVNQPPQISEMTYFTALALNRLGRTQEATACFAQMRAEARQQLAQADLPGYYGVGLPAPLPFELDVKRTHLQSAYLLLALAEQGLGHKAEAQEAVRELVALDPFNTKLDYFRKLGEL